ncbi:MAG: hypothetical protein A3F83_11585 [Candidatus Glassbacteria bacterium RIFCSPLOWO2_12_FULL_58_11]|uniref:CSD domain-containing protein n=1 Tax=Candidatus Glassbacteria bacterium RIFCSPLOWO2_12_FULL_58_11 TaxID=1817867 RepID=A0A1F5YKV0_9BACT|nr:MAG: hypothetical protein A3F83_11585 [Candidatus Glassbacteria bacterium RIFCSPLOWO2_12_FULL_58_11]
MRGKIKWYNDLKGYGFIQREDGADVFVHYSVIEVEGYRALMGDQEVEYDCSEGPRGLQATRVVPVKMNG